jgi:hypothetical protein
MRKLGRETIDAIADRLGLLGALLIFGSRKSLMQRVIHIYRR